ncbi:hypothetical protein [Pantoea sp. App145]|uniref:hypothetical protein n=1 Tax=Pantoea sp. App145 TaxID=3071567 RepID=UPI003A808272
MKLSNDVASDYLRFYNSLTKPGYAVLVRGEWGAGKTHTISEVYKDEMYYVSLFGLTTQKEIYSSVFLSMFPMRSKSKSIAERVKGSTKGTEAVTFGIGNVIGGIADAFIKEEVKNDKVLVFDDLERASLNIKQILGVINKYVEHHDCRVVVIAHDEKIEKEFSETKEKVFGQTLQIVPDIKKALSKFIITSQSPGTAKEIEPYILEVFVASKCQSLRILKHIIEDCLRLYGCLEKRHLEHSVSIRKLFNLFCAFDISFRSGEIESKELSNRIASSIKAYTDKNEEGAEESKYQKMKNKFKSEAVTIEFESNILSDDILLSTICNGFFDKESIINHLDTNNYFSTIENIPSWKSLIHFDELTDQDIQVILDKLLEDEKTLNITDDGDILHTFAMKCLLATSGETTTTPTNILNETKKYIDDLRGAGKLPPQSKDIRGDYYNHDNAHGYGFWILDSYKEEFSTIKHYLQDSRRLSLEDEYPQYANEVLEYMKSDIIKFKEIISRDSNKLGIYSQIPMMASIEPSRFVDEWLSLPRNNWGSVRQALEYRYDTGMLRNVLSDERLWIKKVIAELDVRSSREVGLKRLRITRLTPKVTLE